MMFFITLGAIIIGTILSIAIVSILGFAAFGMVIQRKIYKLEEEIDDR